MAKDLSISLEKLIEEVGCAISMKNMYSIVLPEYTEELDNYLRENDYENDKVIEFLTKNEKKISKEKFLICNLYNYIREKERLDTDSDYKIFIDMQIEKCKKLLEGKSVNLLDRKIDPKTGKVIKITEITSEELCAHDDLNYNSTKKEQLNAEKRKEIYRKKWRKEIRK